MHTNILSNLIIQKVISASTMFSESGRTIKRENRSCWAIVLKYEGETVYTVNNKKYISNSNNMVIIPKGLNYKAKFVKSGHFSIIEFACDTKYDNILCFPIKNTDVILENIKKIEYKRDLKKPLYEIESIRDVYSLIIKLSEEYSRKYIPGKTQQKLIPAVNHITMHNNKKIKNAELAALTGFSTDYFRKIFAQTYGMSPIEYINNLKIKKAKEMLMSDYISITDIAISLGYENIYDFSRSFKKTTGISPSKYRNM